MDQETAKKLFFEGAIFLFLDVPEGTEFGIDMKSWSTGENFRGVKMIPPGIHYIFYSGVSDTGDTAPRTGFFHNFKKSEILARKWDKNLEDVSLEDVDECDIVNFKDNIIALDRFLGPYPYDISERWSTLTSHITESLISRLTPVSGKIKSALEMVPCTDSDRPRGSKNTQDLPLSSRNPKKSRFSNGDDIHDNLLPDLKPANGTELRFTLFPEKDYPEGSTPSEITQHCLDSSYVLETILDKYKLSLDLIGELEFSYICFLVGHSFEAFDHWKRLVSLLCSCEIAIKKHRDIYDAFIPLLEIQVREIPEDFLADIVSNKNFVYVKLCNLFRVVQCSDVDGRLKTKVERFRRHLTDTFNWDFTHLESEDEEDAPVVVEI